MVKRFKVTVNGEVFDVEIEEISNKNTNVGSSLKSAERPSKMAVTETKINKSNTVASEPKREEPKERSEKKTKVNTTGKKIVAAPLPGKILSVNVKKGDIVKKGDLLLVIEAMKMENEIFASQDGVVSDILVGAGDYVSTGDKLIIME